MCNPDVGDAALIVGDTGWFVPAYNPNALAVAIIKAMDERQLNESVWENRRSLSRECIVENFSLEKMIAKYEFVWLEWIKK